MYDMIWIWGRDVGFMIDTRNLNAQYSNLDSLATMIINCNFDSFRTSEPEESTSRDVSA